MRHGLACIMVQWKDKRGKKRVGEKEKIRRKGGT
jgi:hypothetical protein